MPQDSTEPVSPVGATLKDGLAWIAVANPPVNALSHAVRVALMDALDEAEEDDAVRAIVLTGRGHTFPAGADIREFDEGLRDPWVSELCERIAACEKPVIAALHGTVLGSGLEIALAAHYRVAHAEARLGLPEVKLGLIPSGGGTQLVPRLIGAKGALDMLLSGAMLPVTRSPARGLVDLVAEGDLSQAVTQFARDLLAEGRGPRSTVDRRDGFSDPVAYQAEIAARRTKVEDHPELAPREIIGAVEAAMILPYEAGLSLEADAFETCRDSEQSRALRAAFFAERRAYRFDLPPGTALPPVDRVAVLGGGALAAQLVISALNIGLGVNWGTRDPEPLRSGLVHLREVFRQGVTLGGLTEQQAEERMALLRSGESRQMVRDSDMILHAARGQGDVPAPEGAVRAVCFPGPVQELGLRFPPPVYSTRLMEVIAGPNCTQRQLATALSLAKSLGKVPVRVASSGQSISARLLFACQKAADALIDAGQSPYEIDRAFRNWGWTHPPFIARDSIGLSEFSSQPRAEGAGNWSALIGEIGRSGRAGGRGIYDWRTGSPKQDDEVLERIEDLRAPQSTMPPERIRLLILGAMANEGARMLADAMAARPSDVDLVALLAQDMPRWRGGPMHMAGELGMLSVKRALERFDHPDIPFWRPQPLWDDLIKNGRTFAALNG